MAGRALSGLALAATLLGARAARAELACDGERPWVRVQLRAQGFSAAQRERVLLNLEHTLSAQGIDACTEERAPKSEALAALRIDIDAESRASVEIEVRDSVTHKRVGREVDLRPIPDDGRELAVAIEADELLRASWAELALDTERARAAKPRPQVVESVRRVLSPARVRSTSTLGARAAAEYYLARGTVLLGADALGSLSLGPRAALELAVGMRTSPTFSGDHGTVRALAIGAGARLLFRLVGSDDAALDGGGGFSGNWLQFRAEPSAPATASPYTDLLLVARAGLLFHLGLGRSLELSAGLSGGGALRGVEATDAGRVVASASGLELGATLGLGAR
ncbi:MAG TPA: hypothetical protein VG937_33665 [Polyangiaceae bacterium]|nr:hypothetical protein [Polyangiaceae bacterium]